MDSDLPRNVDRESLAAGDPAAFEALYARLVRRLLRMAGAMLADASEAEDAVHDVFVALARGRERLRRVEDLDAYVFASLRNTISVRLKRTQSERVHRERMASAWQPELAPPDPPDEGELAAALAALPPEQREIVLLKVDAGLTFAQIAGVTGVGPNTAASRYRYAIQKLRRTLEDRS